MDGLALDHAETAEDMLKAGNVEEAQVHATLAAAYATLAVAYTNQNRLEGIQEAITLR